MLPSIELRLFIQAGCIDFVHISMKILIIHPQQTIQYCHNFYILSQFSGCVVAHQLAYLQLLNVIYFQVYCLVRETFFFLKCLL